MTELEQLRAENLQMRKMLEWYANRSHWNKHGIAFSPDAELPVVDEGYRAREFLKKYERKSTGHIKSWACIKPDGDGCDGNHVDEHIAKGEE